MLSWASVCSSATNRAAVVSSLGEDGMMYYDEQLGRWVDPADPNSFHPTRPADVSPSLAGEQGWLEHTHGMHWRPTRHRRRGWGCEANGCQPGCINTMGYRCRCVPPRASTDPPETLAGGLIASPAPALAYEAPAAHNTSSTASVAPVVFARSVPTETDLSALVQQATAELAIAQQTLAVALQRAEEDGQAQLRVTLGNEVQ